MKRIQSKAGLLKKRVGRIHLRAKFVGLVYLLATFALAAAVLLLPIMRDSSIYKDGTLTVVFFYSNMQTLPLDKILQPNNLITLLKLALYFVLVLVLVINALRALAKLGWLYKKRASYVNGFNRNMYAMDAMSKRFSSSLASLIIFNVLFMLLTNRSTSIIPTPTVWGYLTMGAAIAIRFIFGVIEGNVTLFTNGKKIVEKRRDHRVVSYWIRNVIQVGIVGGIVYFLATASVLYSGLYTLLDQMINYKNFTYAIHVDMIPTYVEIAGLICIMVMIKHATASTEYSRECNQKKGRHNFTYFALYTTLLFTALAIFPYMGIGVADGVKGELNMSVLWIAIIACIGFLFDLVFRARDKERVEEEYDGDPLPVDEDESRAEGEKVSYSLPIQQQFAYPNYNGTALNVATGEATAANGATAAPVQPVFVPVFYMPNMTPALAPAPAPVGLLPAPSPQTEEEEKAEQKEQEEENDPNRKYKVYCPQCNKGLMVKDGAPYHRCPHCDKVFTLRKFKTYVKSV